MSFSALQRAENSSIQFVARVIQFNHQVSVLFSEPKIPQFAVVRSRKLVVGEFQCSSASRKFLNVAKKYNDPVYLRFQCSSASRKFLNPNCLATIVAAFAVSVLFSEPKIPQ